MERVQVSAPIAVRASNGHGFDIIAEPEVRRLADYWNARRGARRMPRHADIDPVGIPWALSRIYLLDYEPDEDTFRYRLAGGDIEDMFRPHTDGTGLKGKTFKQILPPDVSERMHASWVPMIAQQAALYMSGQVYHAESRRAVGARIILPLSGDDDDTIAGALGFTQCKWEFEDVMAELPPLDICAIPLDEIS